MAGRGVYAAQVIAFACLNRLWRKGRYTLSAALGRPVHRPWMRECEIQIMEEILRRLRPRSCLEWGAGHSTLYFPRLLPAGARWTAIEHEGTWASRLEEVGVPANVTVQVVAANHSPWSDPHGDGAYSDLRHYVEYPERLGPFDFILIDGRARSACLAKAHALLSDHGVVALHDANRVYYHEPFGLYAYQTLFPDHRKEGMGLWVGSKTLDIGTVLNVEKHSMLLRFYASAARRKRIRRLTRHA